MAYAQLHLLTHGLGKKLALPENHAYAIRTVTVFDTLPPTVT